MNDVGVVSGVSWSSSSDDACSTRSTSASFVRWRLRFVVSGVSLPLESVLESSSSIRGGGSSVSSWSSGGRWFSTIRASRVVLVGWSVRCSIMCLLHVSSACSPCTMFPVAGSIIASFVEERLPGKGKAFLCDLLKL